MKSYEDGEGKTRTALSIYQSEYPWTPRIPTSLRRAFAD